MTAQSIVQRRLYAGAIARSQAARSIRLRIRKDLLVIRLMIAAGLVLPALMVFHVVAASFLLVGIAFGLLVVGGILALVRCGEVA